jgi:hypothetical protein
MKRIALIAVAALIALAVAASPASAIQSVQKFSAKVTPSKAGTKAKPRAVAFNANPSFDTIAPDLDQEVQFATVNANVYFPKDGLFNGKYFPSCASSTVFNNEAQCPKGSLVGTAKGRGLGLGLDEDVVGKFFNSPGGKGTTLLVTGESPLIIRNVVPATLTTLTGDPKYKYKLNFSVPDDLQSPAPGVIAAVMKFDTTIPVQYVTKGKGKKKKKIPYLASTGCTGGAWWFKYQADYTTSGKSTTDGGSQTVEVSQPCTK